MGKCSISFQNENTFQETNHFKQLSCKNSKMCTVHYKAPKLTTVNLLLEHCPRERISVPRRSQASTTGTRTQCVSSHHTSGNTICVFGLRLYVCLFSYHTCVCVHPRIVFVFIPYLCLCSPNTCFCVHTVLMFVPYLCSVTRCFRVQSSNHTCLRLLEYGLTRRLSQKRLK